MFMGKTYMRLPAGLRNRPFSLRDAATAWDVNSKVAWRRLQRLTKKEQLVHHGRSLYSVGAPPVRPADRAQKVLATIADLSSYRVALTGLDVLSPYFHYLPARYPHILLAERRAIDDIRLALSKAGFLVVPPSTIAPVWSGAPATPVVVLKPNSNWHGVGAADRVASTERAFLDLLVAVRRSRYPYPSGDVQSMWSDFPAALRQRIARLGRHLQLRPFFDAKAKDARVPTTLLVERPR